ncbi:hypothetical protein CLG96_02325 [Sphingomonas oleivorans]|uniref:Uncharacterized protein n=2 Tax=Sphingomonas oleivorans TaxID=1735121 RepID=A0A2T5G1I5_9SPHN|nr:hypothetical protein CLG96_02325 [Sphingomonas oleivorans]
MALAAPVAAGVEIRRATLLKGKDAAGVARGRARFYIEADVKSLIRGTGGLPAKITYLVDVPTDSANRPPKLRKARMLLLASQVAGRPGEIRLIGPRAQLPWTPENEARIRAILTEALAGGAPPRISGIGNAFHVPGSLPGESETQIFLKTDDGRPISLAILRRPGEQPRWAVALGEMVDNSAEPPRPETLLWYRLACGLPANLPENSLAEAAGADLDAIRADYRLVLAGLGPCGRTTER